MPASEEGFLVRACTQQMIGLEMMGLEMTVEQGFPDSWPLSA